MTCFIEIFTLLRWSGTQSANISKVYLYLFMISDEIGDKTVKYNKKCIEKIKKSKCNSFTSELLQGLNEINIY